MDDALLLEDAGCFSIVLESVPGRLGEYISKKLAIPTIGIGAGSGCDGQVLVTHDLLGMFDRFTPKFARRYANIYGEMERAFTEYRQDVENGAFPGPEHTIGMPDEEWDKFLHGNEKGI